MTDFLLRKPHNWLFNVFWDDGTGDGTGDAGASSGGIGGTTGGDSSGNAAAAAAVGGQATGGLGPGGSGDASSSGSDGPGSVGGNVGGIAASVSAGQGGGTTGYGTTGSFGGTTGYGSAAAAGNAAPGGAGSVGTGGVTGVAGGGGSSTGGSAGGVGPGGHGAPSSAQTTSMMDALAQHEAALNALFGTQGVSQVTNPMTIYGLTQAQHIPGVTSSGMTAAQVAQANQALAALHGAPSPGANGLGGIASSLSAHANSIANALAAIYGNSMGILGGPTAHATAPTNALTASQLANSQTGQNAAAQEALAHQMYAIDPSNVAALNSLLGNMHAAPYGMVASPFGGSVFGPGTPGQTMGFPSIYGVSPGLGGFGTVAAAPGPSPSQGQTTSNAATFGSANAAPTGNALGFAEAPAGPGPNAAVNAIYGVSPGLAATPGVSVAPGVPTMSSFSKALAQNVMGNSGRGF